MKNLDTIFCQACINEYKSEHGVVKPTIMSGISEFKLGHVEGHIGKINDLTVVVFRGSNGTADWVDNFNFVKTDLDKTWFGHECSVHSGFFRQFQQIKNIVFELVRGEKKIIVTGHSLGGAIATLFAAYLARHLSKSQVGCVTFGSPRVGDNSFKKVYNRLVPLTKRYVYGEDIVCKVPPSLRFYYTHVGNKIRLGELSWREILLWLPRKIIGNYKDHEPDRYLKGLKMIYENSNT